MPTPPRSFHADVLRVHTQTDRPLPPPVDPREFDAAVSEMAVCVVEILISHKGLTADWVPYLMGAAGGYVMSLVRESNSFSETLSAAKSGAFG